MKSSCCKGLDVLTARAQNGRVLVGTVAVDVLGVDGGKTYLTLHVVNPSGLVEKEKGSGIAYLTNALAPSFIEETIYSTISDELKKQFKEKGSDVTVEIVKTPPKGSAPSAVTREGIFLGMLLTGLGYGVAKLAGRLMR